MKRLCISLLGHVDAGKTTLSEGLLYLSGNIKKLGRVDHQDAFLDTFELERERGITIFSKQALLSLPEKEFFLLDTPGHVDFSAETERTLQVLDYAILVVSGTDGVQGHTTTLWQLLRRHKIPTFLFINKTDLDGTNSQTVMTELKQLLDDRCIDFSTDITLSAFAEQAALCDEQLLNRYLERGTLDTASLASAIHRCQLFPCYIGSALKLEGVRTLLDGLNQYTLCRKYPTDFRARVYKISRDNQGTRLTWMKITGGQLATKTLLSNHSANGEDTWSEKVDQIRIYSGAKFTSVNAVSAGTICAVTGLSQTFPGEGLGKEEAADRPILEPVLTYQILLPEGTDVHSTFLQLKELADEDPQLHIVWNETLKEIHIQLMGEVQLEVLKQLIAKRFHLDVHFSSGNIVYKETIAAPVEGIGHFEPLRHYAEVHLLLEPGAPGSGLLFDTLCNQDVLDTNWQRLILTHLAEKKHLGVLTGAPITDMKISILTGRAHIKHTEGGDFRQATYRAVRQGLKKAESILLEPWYTFRLELPSEHVGRAMSDMQRMHGTLEGPEPFAQGSVLTGSAPVSTMQDYAREVNIYTKGRGRLFLRIQGYLPCHNQDEVVNNTGYDAERDLDNPADSVFCSRGAGVMVKWDAVEDHMDLECCLRPAVTEKQETTSAHLPHSSDSPEIEDRELQKIFERTYGAIRPHGLEPQNSPRRPKELKAVTLQEFHRVEEFLLVDGYNIIFAWDDLKKLAQQNLEAARESLIHTLCNYQGYHKCHVIIVFDAYKVKGGTQNMERHHNVDVVYTKEAETADTYIEKASYQLGKKYRVRVATSDYTVQLIILGNHATRISARAFKKEVDQVNEEIEHLLDQYRRPNQSPTFSG